MDKIEFLKRLEDVKRRLPRATVPLYLTVYPSASKSRVKNTLAGKIQDLSILRNLEKVAQELEKIKSNV